MIPDKPANRKMIRVARVTNENVVFQVNGVLIDDFIIILKRPLIVAWLCFLCYERWH
jgi:hypothetical protein